MGSEGTALEQQEYVVSALRTITEVPRSLAHHF
jgi:hypothetical protein